MGLLEGGKVRCDWSAEAAILPAEWQRLACNMLVLAAEALPRGGTVQVRPLRAGASGIEVTAEGDSVNVSPELRLALDPAVSVEQLSSRTVHAYFTARLACSWAPGWCWPRRRRSAPCSVRRRVRGFSPVSASIARTVRAFAVARATAGARRRRRVAHLPRAWVD